MGDHRPVAENMTQDEQYEQLVNTGNAATSDDEEDVLNAEFGNPELGIYGKPEREED